MVVHLVCQCGHELDVTDSDSGTSVSCPHCGRTIAAPHRTEEDRSSNDPADEETYLFSRIPDSVKADNTPVPQSRETQSGRESSANDSTGEATAEFTAPEDFDEEATRIAVLNESETADFHMDGEQATRIFDAEAKSTDSQHDFVLPGREDGFSADDETKFASVPPSGGGSQAGHRHGSSICSLDLSERVMGTISRSSVPVNAPTTTEVEGYGVHRILRTHQKGGMGRILIAYDQYLKRDIALKELHPEVAEDMSIVRRFIGEAEITAQLEHPGIVPIHVLGKDQNGYPYYTMKLIRGHTLQEVIKTYHRNPSKQELMQLVRRLVSICKTMAFAHNKGVIHRDLKPANIMLGEHGETLVMDWGLAKPFDLRDDDHSAFTSVALQHHAEEPRPELTMIGAVVGTPAFMSPEQASPEESVVGPLSDIFSLGTILYYLLAGQTAFSGRSTQEVLSRVRAAAPKPPSAIKPNVPTALEAICAKAMAKNPADRYQTAGEMDADLCRWLDGEPVKAQKETFAQRMKRWFDRHRILTISIPFILVLVIVLTNIGIYVDRAGRQQAEEEAVREALSRPVDLTDQNKILFEGSSGISVTKEARLTGGDMIVCRVDVVPKSQKGFVEVVVTGSYAWDLSRRNGLQLSIFEPRDPGPERSGPLSTFFVRMGRGSAYFEYRPDPAWWSTRRLENWHTFTIPLSGSSVWTKTETDNPDIKRIEWIEFHFDVFSTEDKFRIDNISFLDKES